MHEAQHRGLPCFSLLVKHLRPSRYTSSSLVSFLSSSITFSSSVCRSLLGAPDIYGIFLIARSLHSALLARSAPSCPGSARPRRTPGTKNVSIFITVDASAAHTVPNCGQVLSRLFETRPDIATDDLAEINPPVGVLES